ncbi:MAG: hypothetical protein NC102_10415 [Clostridium sp.]|nr:hypothetical protein [Clostridium sp.]
MATTPKYCIYPSLLIAYQGLLDLEHAFEEPWNIVSEKAHERGEYLDREVGDYKLTPDEMYLKLECDLLDSINRVYGRFGEAADKGTAFNEIVDCLIENRKSSREDCKIHTTYTDMYYIIYLWANQHKSKLGEDVYSKIIKILKEEEKVIRAEIHDYIFDFDINFCKQAAEYFKGSLPQYLAKATIDTSYGDVLLYGYIDEWVGNKMYDIKTTSSYKWGKFEKGWQRWVYPYCVIEAGDTTEVESFTYWVVEWDYCINRPLTAKNICEETYTYDHEEATRKIREICEGFIDWLESRRDFIQDKRIFGGENPEGWHGKPTSPQELSMAIFGKDISNS